MRSSPRLFVPRLDWIVFVLTVGFSLTLLFFSDSAGVAGAKREIGGVLTLLTRPIVQVRRVLDIFRENDELRTAAMELESENVRLRDYALENARLRSLLDFRERFPYPLLSASVVAYPGSDIGGKFIIDRGRKDGVMINSAVVTPRGLVGKVVETATHSAVVQTLVGNAFGVSVVIERSRAMGILKWIGPTEWTISGLSTGEDVLEGDLVLTTGYGFVFPPGIRVGVVSELLAQSRQGMGFTRVRPFVRFDSVEELFVVTAPDSKGKSEQDSLINIEAEQ